MDWSRRHTIGHGSSATVSLATYCQSGDIFAVKSAELSQSDFLQREQRILSSLSSPYIVSYRGCDITEENHKLMYNLLMEYISHGTLMEATRRHGMLSESMIAYYTGQILKGLEYLHSNGLVHCDIKGSNILVGEEGVKIADFGCAKRVFDDHVETKVGPIGGTPMFMAPEVARGEEQGYPTDIWALGCTIIEMATGVAPWPNVADPVSVLYRIAYSRELPEIPSILSDQAKDFLRNCLRRNPKERWTASQLLKHPFLEEFNCNGKKIQQSNSSSPTSILDQGFWNSVYESESFCNLSHSSSENSPVYRIRRLAVNSEEPSWTWDEHWITTRGNKVEVQSEIDMICGSVTASTSYGEEGMVENSVSGRIGDHFLEGYRYRDISVVISNLNSERHIDKMLVPSISIFS
ncbi:putative Mitogen-activated protein kinase kinase kinase [Quillaja saponaria]|uniref:mitogen-activated protein kinase kinase kinase n=1 Tax=Quillaja saponaria TaxID=32244 RepID=A0AAD7KYE4_QUISA|nr:putative Mitogen-activated protein kinase kinase kinase [Quillaja saponaria]